MSGETWRSGIDLNPHHEDIRANRDTFDFVRAGCRWPGRGRGGSRCGIYTPDAYVSPNATQLVSDDPQRDRFINTVDCGQGPCGDATVCEAHSNAFSADTWFMRDGPGNPYYMTRVHSAQLSIRWTGFLSPLESG